MNVKKRILVITALLSIQIFSCSGGGANLYYRPAERADVDIIGGRAGLVRTVYCDIYIEYVDAESWSYLKKFNVFKGKGSDNPADSCFHFIIVNTWNKPFVVDQVESSYKDEVAPAEDYSFIKDKDYLENRYSVSVSSLLKKRRIISERELLAEIDFDGETTEYRLDFIAPGDKVSFFRFFRRIPAGKSSKIRVGIKYLDLKKVIDFDISRFEYKEIINQQE